MKVIRIIVGSITALFSVIFLAKFLLEIIWGLLELEKSNLNIIQVFIISATLLTVGLISVIYHDVNAIIFRLMQVALYFAGTVLIMLTINIEDVVYNIIKIWMCMATIVMFFVLIFQKEDKAGNRKVSSEKGVREYEHVFSSKWEDATPDVLHVVYCPFCGRRTDSHGGNELSGYNTCLFCNKSYKITILKE